MIGLEQMRSEALLRRAALWIGLTTTLFSLAIGAWFYQQAGRVIDETLNSQAVMLASGLASAVEQDLVTRDYSALELKLRQSLANMNVVAALVADPSGTVLSHVRRDPSTTAVDSVFQPPSVPLPSTEFQIDKKPDQVEIWRAVPRQHPVGWVKLELSPDRDAGTIETLRWQMIVLTCVGAAGMILVLGLTMMNVRAGVAHVQSRLEHAATHDGLTGLPNRLALMARLRNEIAQCRVSEQSIAVCFLDIDNFKDVNDRYGHDAGDRVLIQVAQRLRKVLRQSDTVARIAGDEFVLLITNVRSQLDYRELLGRVMAGRLPSANRRPSMCR